MWLAMGQAGPAHQAMKTNLSKARLSPLGDFLVPQGRPRNQNPLRGELQRIPHGLPSGSHHEAKPPKSPHLCLLTLG